MRGRHNFSSRSRPVICAVCVSRTTRQYQPPVPHLLTLPIPRRPTTYTANQEAVQPNPSSLSSPQSPKSLPQHLIPSVRSVSRRAAGISTANRVTTSGFRSSSKRASKAVARWYPRIMMVAAERRGLNRVDAFRSGYVANIRGE